MGQGQGGGNPDKLARAHLYRHRAGWRVAWWGRGDDGKARQYAVSVPAGADGKAWLAGVSLGLMAGQWPAWLAGAAAVRRWRAAQAGAKGGGDAINEYMAIVRGEVSAKWAGQTERTLRAAAAAVGDLSRATEAQVAAWLDKAKAAQTRNNALVIVKKFYKWATRAKGWANPAAELRQRQEARSQLAIAAYDAAERDAMLEAARGVKRGVAVWVALLAGLRLNEILRLEWQQIDLDAGTLITQSKRGAARVVPVSRRLEAYLREVGPGEPGERVCGAAGLIGMRRIAGRMRRAGFPAFSWQTCRHTFCSLLARAGVSIDKICSWSGHSPAVCRRHYARFVPRAGRDADIDRG